jgi:excisionase family DNA binding protein
MKPGKTLPIQAASARKKIQEKRAKLAREERRTISIGEAARLLGVSRQSAYTYAQDGLIPVIKLGTRLLVPKAAFDRLLEGTEA